MRRCASKGLRSYVLQKLKGGGKMTEKKWYISFDTCVKNRSNALAVLKCAALLHHEGVIDDNHYYAIEAQVIDYVDNDYIIARTQQYIKDNILPPWH